MIQQSGLFPHRTIEDNIGTVPLLIGWGKGKARARARELMALVGLDEDLARRYPYQLSGGQQQRVGVARALAADPPVLLMDEPFSAVDPIVRATLQDELLRLQAELHKTVVLVTHDVEEAIKVGDQVAIFRPGGKIAQLDTPERLLAAPADGVRGELPRLRPRYPPAVVPGRLRAQPGRPGRGGRGRVRVGGSRRRAEGRRGGVGAGHRRRAPAPRLGRRAAISRRCPAGRGPGRPGWSRTATRSTCAPTRCGRPWTPTVLSPTGQAVGVDDDGRVVGVTSYDRLRVAIHAADHERGTRTPSEAAS